MPPSPPQAHLERGDLSDGLVFDAVRVEQVPAEFDLGKGLSRLADDSMDIEERLAQLARRGRHSALVGYLWGRIESGIETSFDDFLDRGAGQALPPDVRLALTARGPATDDARQRADTLSAERPVIEAVQTSFALWRDIPPAELARRLSDLIPRVTSQEDYNALLDFVSLSLHRQDGEDPPLADVWIPLLRLRSSFPSLGSQAWAWGQLGVRAARAHPVETTRLVLDLVDQDTLRLYSPGEGEVLRIAVQVGGAEAWEIVMSTVQTGNWKLRMGVDGWFGGLNDLDAICAWVGDDPDRARAVASVSTVGEGREMHEVALYLLSTFPEDRRIESSFYGEFVSGSWVGDESARINKQIALLEGWHRAHADVAGVAHWCTGVLDSLQTQLASALQREAEEDWH